jgi:hypothetical protein
MDTSDINVTSICVALIENLLIVVGRYRPIQYYFEHLWLHVNRTKNKIAFSFDCYDLGLFFFTFLNSINSVNP